MSLLHTSKAKKKNNCTSYLIPNILLQSKLVVFNANILLTSDLQNVPLLAAILRIQPLDIVALKMFFHTYTVKKNDFNKFDNIAKQTFFSAMCRRTRMLIKLLRNSKYTVDLGLLPYYSTKEKSAALPNVNFAQITALTPTLSTTFYRKYTFLKK